MRRDHPDVSEPQSEEPLPAPPAVVVAALGSLLTDQRLARIDDIIHRRTRSVVPVLDGLIDPHNTAAVLRSADAFGAQEVHVIEGPEAFVASARVAKGTQRWVDVVRHPNAESCVQALRERGFRVLAAGAGGELGPADLTAMRQVAVVFGGEHAGVSTRVRQLCDSTYSVPMRGFVESLNVSVAAAVTLYAATLNRAGDLPAEERAALRARFMMLSVPRAKQVVCEYLRRHTKKR